ncbi:Por secretion system C-terminal sorting domain-containing protein [Chryseobacterium arachidis]|uniref:Por secretion system C-terminal sorting domain-containing protein n=3 Tax=Chryseobacterium arachidis TaxID=1416778 RepID=A0A1M5ABT0_9FLAO|nr:M12 family metallo-peptidase [Chryseobacterium arachidis]SHF27635.1 Por secretion system C-terminal sorting domain-containing protein [Chryseobacterium arachidis]
MKKLITLLMCGVMGGTAFAQWTPTAPKRSSKMELSLERNYYKLDINQIRSQLKNAQEMGQNAKPVEISLPTLSGKIERFAVYSFPVMAKDLADKYELGSYAGVGIDDPTKYLRFSVAPNDFQSMIMNNGQYEFIEPSKADKTIYAVHPKTVKNENGFFCSTEEGPAAQQQINQMLKAGSSFTNQPTDFSKNSDKKYRTLRLVLSTTGEYTQFFGGVPGALAQINATITRVNAVFEKDFALHLNVLSYPDLVYPDAASDPYDTVTNPSQPPGTWNTSLRDILAANVGQANYDIGHLFGASGGGGNAGCIGCVCMSPVGTGYDPVVGYGKGSGITSPATGTVNPSAANPPSGDNFDIDYVAHELGHQLGANHTFAHTMQGSPVQMEPGSGSTIMAYAGITGSTTDVQPHSDPYFFKGSIDQVQTNLISKTCDTEVSVNNNPPVIADLPTYNIPKGTAFVLTASATDPENDPMTYTWEEVDNTNVVINKTNIGTTATGATFRSLSPTSSPTRYFPKLESVLNGFLDNSNNTWESVSQVARTTNFAVTVRDNNSDITQQQTSSKVQQIVVGNNGPFKINTQFADSTAPTVFSWDVASTNAAPYNVANVKIDYTTDNGTSWTILAASTPNDGSESVTIPSSLNGQTIKVRISAIGNVFYAVKAVNVTVFAPCNGNAPTSITANGITTSSANISWAPVANATYVVRYKKVSETVWTTINTSALNVTLSNLPDGTAYEVQVATVCSGTTGTFSSSVNFTTLALGAYCAVATTNATDDHIASVSLGTMTNASGPSTYTSYVANPALQVNLVKGSQYTLSVTKGWSSTAVPEMITAWIDFNRNGTFEDSERIMQSANTVTANPVTSSFTVPSTAVSGLGLRMRIGLLYYQQSGYIHNSSCGTVNTYGEYEDYNVVVSEIQLATNDVTGPKNNGIQIYPNPVSDILNVTKVSEKAAYKIYSAAGQLVRQGNINDGKINVSELIKGGYVITIEDKGREAFTSKFIKK